MQEIITKNSKETKKLASELVGKIKDGKVICLEGDLGSGKTTFTQGLLEALKVKGPYTSPTFVIMKEYKTKNINIYHIDAYRVNSEDILSLGWEEMINPPTGGNIVIVEWADRIKDIILKDALWIKFEWLNENERKIVF